MKSAQDRYQNTIEYLHSMGIKKIIDNGPTVLAVAGRYFAKTRDCDATDFVEKMDRKALQQALDNKDSDELKELLYEMFLSWQIDRVNDDLKNYSEPAYPELGFQPPEIRGKVWP